MEIRESAPSELASIEALHMDAFGEEENQAVSKLAVELARQDRSLSLLATDSDQILGHIIFSPIRISGNENLSGFILAPLAVSPFHQKQGVGKALIQHGLNYLQAQGVGVVFVLGDPNYYGLCGFQTKHEIQAPYAMPYPQAWQVIELKSGALEGVTGVLECVPALMSPDLW